MQPMLAHVVVDNVPGANSFAAEFADQNLDVDAIVKDQCQVKGNNGFAQGKHICTVEV